MVFKNDKWIDEWDAWSRKGNGENVIDKNAQQFLENVDGNSRILTQKAYIDEWEIMGTERVTGKRRLGGRGNGITKCSADIYFLVNLAFQREQKRKRGGRERWWGGGGWWVSGVGEIMEWAGWGLGGCDGTRDVGRLFKSSMWVYILWVKLAFEHVDEDMCFP